MQTIKSVLVVGGTGMVGRLALQELLQDPQVERVTSIARRRCGLRNPKLEEVEHQDFSDFSPVNDSFEGRDLALFCLGAYTGSVPDAEFRRITVDFTSAFGAALRTGSPEASLCFLSGQGADSKEKSSIAFARYKGEAENQLLRLGFPRLHIFRPGYIYPVEIRQEPNFNYRVLRWLYPVLSRLYRNLGLTSVDLARAMVHAGLHGTGDHDSAILENRDIRKLVTGLAA